MTSQEERVAGSRRIEPINPEWGEPATSVNRWPALVATLVAVLLYATLPSTFFYGPRWLVPAIEGLLFVGLLGVRQAEKMHWQRYVALVLIAVINAANIGSLLLLIHALIGGGMFHGHRISAYQLIIWSAQIWLTNVIIFALWYWELDRGGPAARCNPHHREPDFLFPQMATPGATQPDWTPSFFDYLYTSYTNATAFSPTDTMPLTEWAKLLMMIQSAASLLTVALVAARAVNILQ